LKELFKYNEISVGNFTFILRKISRQIERLELGLHQFSRVVDDKNDKNDIFENIINYLRPKNEDHINKYIRNRTRVIITRKVIKELELLCEIKFPFANKVIEETIVMYKEFHNSAKEKMDEI